MSDRRIAEVRQAWQARQWQRRQEAEERVSDSVDLASLPYEERVDAIERHQSHIDDFSAAVADQIALRRAAATEKRRKLFDPRDAQQRRIDEQIERIKARRDGLE